MEQVKTITLATSGPAFEHALTLLHPSHQWTELDDIPEVREQLIREYSQRKSD